MVTISDQTNRTTGQPKHNAYVATVGWQMHNDIWPKAYLSNTFISDNVDRSSKVIHLLQTFQTQFFDFVHHIRTAADARSIGLYL